MAVIIDRGRGAERLEIGESITLQKAGGIISTKSNLTVTFETAGYISYRGLVTAGNYGTSKLFACKGKRLETDLVITAKEYGKPEDSPLPTEIYSESEMDALLLDATYDSVGAVYKYVGEYSDTYEYGKLYIIAAEDD